MSDKTTKLTIEQVGDSFFCDEMRNLVQKQPYLSFLPMGAFLEFIAKVKANEVLSKRHDSSGQLYYNAINTINALYKYKKLSDHTNKKSLLYSALRCGMVHCFIPKQDITLCADRNNLNCNVIGAQEFYEDLAEAWKELKRDMKFKQELAKNSLYVVDSYSASTESNVMKI